MLESSSGVYAAGMKPGAQALRRLLREPAVQFALLGAAFFGLHSILQGQRGEARTIVITRAALAAEPGAASAEEVIPMDRLRERVDRAIDDEVLYREALAQGLDREDPIVRRRLVQKMEFLSEDLAEVAPPSDAELESFRLAHAELFTEPAWLSFSQLFLERERHGAQLDSDARALLARLAGGPSSAAVPGGLGDPFLPGSRFERQTERRLVGIFGEDFARAAFGLERGRWQGPVASAFGLHLVRVEERHDAALPELSRIRGLVKEAFLEDRRAREGQRARAALRARYRIQIEPGLLAEPGQGQAVSP